jgi:hypothetical protein
MSAQVPGKYFLMPDQPDRMDTTILEHESPLADLRRAFSIPHRGSRTPGRAGPSSRLSDQSGWRTISQAHVSG